MKKSFVTMLSLLICFTAFSQQTLRDGFEQYQLSNGMKVYLWVDKDMPNVYGQVAVKAGSIDEPADFTGLAHYLEHMLFKGTQQIGALDWNAEKPMYDKIIALYDDLAKLRLPANKKDKNYAAVQAQRDELMKQINDLTVACSKISRGSEIPTLLQFIGGTDLNAYTYYDRTVYHNTFPSFQVENWLKIYYDRLINPVFREFQPEIENVFEELNLRTPSVSYQQQAKFLEILFKGSTYERDVIGSPEHLKNPSMSPMIKFFNDWYVPNNMGLMLVGNFDPAAVKPMIEKTFGQLKSQTLPERKPTLPTPLTKNEKIKVKLGYSPMLIMGFDGVREGHPDELKIDFVLSLLMNGYRTGFFDKLSIDGEVGGIEVSPISFRDCGKIIVVAEPYFDLSQYTYASDAATEKLILTEIAKLKSGNVPSWLIASAKEQYLQRLKRYAESSDVKTNILTSVFLNNEDIEKYFNMAEQIKAITIDDVKAIANKYFSGFYTTISFSEGEPKKELYAKAELKPLDNPDDKFSQYYADFIKKPVVEPAPVYTDYSDVKQQTLFNGGELFYVENKKNDIFSLILEYKVGTHNDKKLQYAAALMNVSGTLPSQSNNDLRRELAKYGASYGVGIDENNFYIQVIGNEKDLEKIMPIIFKLCLMPKLDNKQIEAMMMGEVQQRMFEKRIPAYGYDALMQYIQYGDQSPYIDRYTSKELIFIGSSGYNFLITNTDLTAAIQKVTSYPVNVHYAGQKPLADVAKILQGNVPTQKTMLPAQPDFYKDRVQYDNDKPVIYLLDNSELQQANVALYFPTGSYSNDEEIDYAAFNQYFGGGGLNNLFFLNIREKRCLAYSTYAIAAKNPYNKTSYLVGSTGTQNDKVANVVDVYMDLLNNMPQYPSLIDNIKPNVKAEYLGEKPSFRDKSMTLEALKKIGYTEDPAKANMSKIEALTFDNILNVYKKIKKAPIIVIYGDKKNIDIKAIESKYGKIQQVPLSKIFKGGDY